MNNMCQSKDVTTVSMGFSSIFLRNSLKVRVGLITLMVLLLMQSGGCAQSLGIFDNSSDVGSVTHAGSARFIQDSNEYRITGGGENIWGQKDAFQYLWKRGSGDFSLTTGVRWIGVGKNPHRKAGWMIRQSLTADSPYADAVVHGNGLACLQFRKTRGGQTEEIQSPGSAPAFVRLERRGQVFSLYISEEGKVFQPAGSVSVALHDPVYVGLFVCSHDDTTTETAIFSKVDMKSLGTHKMEDRTVESSLEIISVETGQRRIVYRAGRHFEAPNWSRDGKYLLFNSEGRLYTIPVSGGEPTLLDTGAANHCNNDHGFSPDGKLLAISDQHEGKSLIYVLPAAGGTPRRVTELGPSYWHGWSPDGKTLAYCGERNGNYDIYTIPVEGGRETRLTSAKGLDDGPDYSPDGRYIYFNSERAGAMKIWRMDNDGGNQIQLTNDDQYADWFPHPSADGTQIVFLSYDKDVKGHPANKDVALRIMTSSEERPRVLTRLFGGQGTINVPSWSPDNKYIAFVSYSLVGRDGGN
jgi:TolB protein